MPNKAVDPTPSPLGVEDLNDATSLLLRPARALWLGAGHLKRSLREELPRMKRLQPNSILRLLRSPLFLAGASLLVISVIAVIADSKLWHHRVSMKLRAWSPIALNTREIIDQLRSPSGESTAYIVSAGFLDPSYTLYVSDGGISPKSRRIDTGSSELYYFKDFTGTWAGTKFTVGQTSYDEDSRQIVGDHSRTRANKAVDTDA